MPEEFDKITIGNSDEEQKSPLKMLTRKNAIKPANKKQYMVSTSDFENCILDEIAREESKNNAGKELSAPKTNGVPENFYSSAATSYSCDLNNNNNSNNNSCNEKLYNYSYNKEYDVERKNMATKLNIPPAGFTVPSAKSNGVKKNKVFY